MIPQPITYDNNGNMLTIPDKGITAPIIYNYLNLPQVIIKNSQPVTYTYRADGVKVHKSFEVNGQNIQTWYLDGFVYTTPYTPDIVIALEKTPEAEEMSVAGQRESFELADKVIVDPGGPIDMVESKPDFFATAEGFYDFNTFRYIYQYRDHLGNIRLNFARDEDNLLYSEDRNDYYPFGLNFINPVPSGPAQLYNPSATYKNYKYNGKELQETGMYDYGARFYMPDIGRWGVVDPLAEADRRWTPYRYAYNNPIRFIDPDGMLEGDYYDNEGTYLGNDGKDDNKVYQLTEKNQANFENENVNWGGTLSEEHYTELQDKSSSGTVENMFVTGDAVSDKRIQSLHPAIRMKATNFINEANDKSGGTLIRVAQGFRTYEEQNTLYAQGRTTKGSVVTNAKGGQSNHNFGLAFDIVGVTNGNMDYNLNWKSLSEIGKSNGLDWGGDWKFKDMPHFENMFGKSLQDLRALPKSKGLPILKP